MPGRTLTIVALMGALAASHLIASRETPPKLDYEFFKSRVEPVFLTKRPDHARCYACHVESNNAFHLREAFTRGARLDRRAIAPQLRNAIDTREPRRSRYQPAAASPAWRPKAAAMCITPADGSSPSKRDPAWRTLAAWVNGATLASPKK